MYTAYRYGFCVSVVSTQRIKFTHASGNGNDNDNRQPRRFFIHHSAIEFQIDINSYGCVMMSNSCLLLPLARTSVISERVCVCVHRACEVQSVFFISLPAIMYQTYFDYVLCPCVCLSPISRRASMLPSRNIQHTICASRTRRVSIRNVSRRSSAATIKTNGVNCIIGICWLIYIDLVVHVCILKLHKPFYGPCLVLNKSQNVCKHQSMFAIRPMILCTHQQLEEKKNHRVECKSGRTKTKKNKNTRFTAAWIMVTSPNCVRLTKVQFMRCKRFLLLEWQNVSIFHDGTSKARCCTSMMSFRENV